MANKVAERVGDTVRAEMARNRVTQGALATNLRLSQAAVSRRLAGEIPFNVEELAVVARVVGVTLSRLTAGADRRSHAPQRATSTHAVRESESLAEADDDLEERAA